MKKITLALMASVLLLASCKKDSKTDSSPSTGLALSGKFDYLTRNWRLVKYFSNLVGSPLGEYEDSCMLDNVYAWNDNLTWSNTENGIVCSFPIDKPVGNGTWNFNTDSSVVLMYGTSSPSNLNIVKLEADSFIFSYFYSIAGYNYETKYVMIPK